HGRDGRIESRDSGGRCGRGRRGGGRRRRRFDWKWRGDCFRFGRLQPLLERLDAGLVAFLQLLDLLADFGELGIGGGVRGRREDERQRECAWRQNEPV